MERLNKKGYELSALVGLAITFIVIAIVLSFGANIVDDIRDDQTENSTAWNASGHGLESLDTFAGWLPTLALIVVAAVIIGIIVRYFAFR